MTFPNARHTLGPWAVGSHGVNVHSPDGYLVARCAGTRDKYEYEAANACLIAAAPELLALAKQIAASQIPEAEDYADEARRLISKAEGGAA